MTMRVAVVDGVGSGRWLARALADRGAQCLHIKSRPALDPHLEATFRPDEYVLDLGYDHDIGRLATRLGNMGVTWIAAGHASAEPVAEALARLTGLPGNAPEAAEARRDRRAMARRLYEAGLDAPSGAAVTSPDEAVAWFTEAGVGASGVQVLASDDAEQVQFCTTAAQVHAAVTAVLGAAGMLSAPGLPAVAAMPGSANVFGGANQTAVVREALTGPEFWVSTVSVDGVHMIAETWRRTLARTAARPRLSDFEEPVDPASPEAGAVHGYLLRALDALGVRHGAARSRVMLTARGPVLLDPGTGLGGAVLPWVAEKFLGYSHAGLLAESIVAPRDLLQGAGRLPEPWPDPTRHVSLMNLRPGTVRPSQHWAGALEALPTAVAVVPAAGAGLELPVTHDETTSPGFVYLSATDPARIERDYQTIREWEQQGPYTA